jgi:hypothetical protein
MELHSTIGVLVQYWCPPPSIKQNAPSVRLAVPNHGAVYSEKIGDTKKRKNGDPLKNEEELFGECFLMFQV